MMDQLAAIMRRIVFTVAALSLGLAVFEKLSNYLGYTLIRGSAYRLLDFVVAALLVVVVLELRELRRQGGSPR